MPFIQGDLSGLSPPLVGDFKKDYKGYLSAYRSFVLFREEIFRSLDFKTRQAKALKPPKEPKMAPVGMTFMAIKKPEGEDTRKRVTLNKAISYADAAKRGLAPAPKPQSSPEEKARRKRESRKRRTPAQLTANLAKDPAAMRDLEARTAVEVALAKLTQAQKKRGALSAKEKAKRQEGINPLAPKHSQVGPSGPPPPKTAQEPATGPMTPAQHLADAQFAALMAATKKAKYRH